MSLAAFVADDILEQRKAGRVPDRFAHAIIVVIPIVFRTQSAHALRERAPGADAQLCVWEAT
ncbi:hypothetical protein LuPra_01893 [Luteitalea pratensis]|uniref:Uncharacterized protein n=1 Tax=Luteitalea pratensis TaxID=1855912 RepID=A0A143PLN8_LUTPR|nr:hypothetical protein LuPra_01893 [Luteitalea pratensis]